MTKHPFVFEPIPMERVWGGRRIESLPGRNLPPDVPIGESWELVDRPDVQSVVADGPFRGATLHDLWHDHRSEVFGAAYAVHPAARFPILLKVLDARERLSVQVHPPAAIAPSLGGEPKTEMWYFLDCLPGASIFAGLKKGVSARRFEESLRQGSVEEVIHRISVETGDRIFIPSGRLHAIGDGCLIIEVQQNSDTTYRVFDWNRTGLDGKPRALHLSESLASIDFNDFEPQLGDTANPIVATCEYFHVQKMRLDSERELGTGGRFEIWTVVSGQARCGDRVFGLGETFLAPGGGELAGAPAAPGTELLRTTLSAGACTANSRGGERIRKETF